MCSKLSGALSGKIPIQQKGGAGVLYLINSLGEITASEHFKLNKGEGLSVALGCFDGVHRGHQRLMESASAKQGLTPAVWTFSEPLTFPYIDNVACRISAFGRHGIRLAVCESFADVKTLTPEQFVMHLVKDYNVRHFVCGADFRYGINRSGWVENLKTDAKKYGATAEVIPPLMTDSFPSLNLSNEKISATLIRRLLALGDVERAHVLLGRPFEVKGHVIHGKGIGHVMNIPTVNQKMEDGRVMLRHGVYDTVTVIDGERYPSVTNFGLRPTVNENQNDLTCETHVIGEALDLYGKSVTVEFYRFAREEKRFSSLDELKEAVLCDIKRAKGFFEDNQAVNKRR